MSWPAIKRACTQEEFRVYVEQQIWRSWRPSLIVWHNTAAPSLAQWDKTAREDAEKGLVPGVTRINNLERYFKDQRGWTGAPHLFIAWDYIWVFNQLTSPGVHSPSWNSSSIGIEMIGDFDREDDDAGIGLKVKNNTIFATAILCEALGLDPSAAVRLHREDPRTTHKCPGVNIAKDKLSMIVAVGDLLAGGEHVPNPVPAPEPAGRRGTVLVDDLNVRTGPGVTNPSVAKLGRGAVVTVVGEASGWLRVRLPGQHEALWVAERYVKIEG